jgi:GT2 family glycosyltransferase
MNMSNITFVLTSCGRYDLLRYTLKSFLQYNTHPIEKYIIIEDGAYNNELGAVMEEYPWMEWIVNGKRIGQIKSVDKAYKLVTTDYLFHCEDDWEFYRTGFIEKSLEVLEQNPKIIQLWLRERTDTMGHPVEGDFLSLGYMGRWHGFSFNPALKRMSDYLKIGASYEKITKNETLAASMSEAEIGIVYKDLGYRAMITEQGYVKHIGWGRHV